MVRNLSKSFRGSLYTMSVYEFLASQFLACFSNNPVVQSEFPIRIDLIGYQTIVFILSFFRNFVSKSNQIDSLKNAQDDPNNHLNRDKSSDFNLLIGVEIPCLVLCNLLKITISTISDSLPS